MLRKKTLSVQLVNPFWMLFEKLWMVRLDGRGMIQGRCSCSGYNCEFYLSFLFFFSFFLWLFIVKEHYHKWTLWVEFIASVGFPDFHCYVVIENAAGYSAFSVKANILDPGAPLFSGSGHIISWFVVFQIVETLLLMSAQRQFEILCGLEVFLQKFLLFLWAKI